MSKIELIAELATNHGGDLSLAKEMCDYAAAGGATHIKTQAYLPESVNPADPQAEWLKQAALSEDDHWALKAHCDGLGVTYFASVFDQWSRAFVARTCGAVKFASSETIPWWVFETAQWPHQSRPTIYKSLAWGSAPSGIPIGYAGKTVRLATVPLYPAPLETVGRVHREAFYPGWSDHCEGLSGCEYAIAHGSRVVEVHVSIPGKGRNCSWDKTQDDLKRLREWLEDCETMTSGVPRRFRERWLR